MFSNLARATGVDHAGLRDAQDVGVPGVSGAGAEVLGYVRSGVDRAQAGRLNRLGGARDVVAVRSVRGQVFLGELRSLLAVIGEPELHDVIVGGERHQVRGVRVTGLPRSIQAVDDGAVRYPGERGRVHG